MTSARRRWIALAAALAAVAAAQGTANVALAAPTTSLTTPTYGYDGPSPLPYPSHTSRGLAVAALGAGGPVSLAATTIAAAASYDYLGAFVRGGETSRLHAIGSPAPLTARDEAAFAPAVFVARARVAAEEAGSEAGYVYRGVVREHPGFDEALKGNAYPRNPDSAVTAEEHNLGNTDSPFTSWTHDVGVARRFAGPNA